MSAADLRCKALLPDRACHADQGGTSQAGRTSYRTHRTVHGGRSDHRLRRTPGDGPGACACADAYEVRVALGVVGPGREDPTHDRLLRRVWGGEKKGQPWLVPRGGQEAPAQAGRRCQQP